MKFYYTDHAEENIKERELSKRTIEEVVLKADQVIGGKFGRQIAQEIVGGKLLRIVFEEKMAFI